MTLDPLTEPRFSAVDEGLGGFGGFGVNNGTVFSKLLVFRVE
jgi:hypothetical protein